MTNRPVALLLLLASPLAAQVTGTAQASGTEALLVGVSPVNERIVWVSGVRGTWGRTTDGGNTWTIGRVPGADTLQFRDVHGVDAETAYLLSIGAGEQSRIYKTSDGGRTWVLQFANREPGGFYDCFDFWDRDHGLVIGDASDGRLAILATTNGGRTWDRIPSERLPAANPGEGSFAASGGCLRTGPGGKAWVVMSNPGQARLLATGDYGKTWSVTVLPLPVREAVGPAAVHFRDAQHGVILGGSTSPEPGDPLGALLVTSDGGKTWIARSRPPLPKSVYGGGYVPGQPAGRIVAVGPDGIAFSGDDGLTWQLVQAGNYWSVAMASSRVGWAVGTRGRITRLSLADAP
jgi:photosystem II stability/assembly factor-like uncharacterized protein